MSIQIIDGFQVNTALPIDNRIVASGSNARDAIPYKYEGLRVFDTSDGLAYVWMNNTWNNENASGVNGTSTTANYIPKFSSSNVIGNSIIYQSVSGNIGIDTITPAYKFVVDGDISVTGTGNKFIGNGSGITDINANNISTGNLALARMTNGTPGYVLVGGTTNPVYLNTNQLSVGTSSCSINVGLTNSVSSDTNYFAMFENSTTGPVKKKSTIYYDAVDDSIYFGTSKINTTAQSTLHKVIDGNGFVALGMAGSTSFNSTIETVTLTGQCLVYVEATFVSRIVEFARSTGYINGTTKLIASYHMNTSGVFTQVGTTTTVYSQANTVGSTTGTLGTPTINTATSFNIAFKQSGSAVSGYQYYTSVNYRIIINKGY